VENQYRNENQTKPSLTARDKKEMESDERAELGSMGIGVLCIGQSKKIRHVIY
jgi:hypothetical protein